MFPEVVDVPHVTTKQMVEVDRIMTEDLGISLLQMMENAGRALAELARRRFFGGDVSNASVAVLAGPGGNGGGAMACARRLHAWGASVLVLPTTADENALSHGASRQFATLRRMGVEVGSADELEEAPGSGLIIDGLLGYNLTGAPRGPAKDLISWAGQSSVPVLSLDVPSGLDSTTGDIPGVAIRASATLTLALPKSGLQHSSGRELAGEIYLADISVPPKVYSRAPLNLRVGPLFAAADIVRPI